MKVIVFLTEPASYTIDLARKVYKPNDINYKFLYTSSYSKPKAFEQFEENLFLDKLSIISRIKTLKKDYKEHDIIMFSGYTSISFLLLLIIHVFSKHKKPISVISDTPLKIPSNLFRRIAKKWYLNFGDPSWGTKIKTVYKQIYEKCLIELKGILKVFLFW